MKNLKQIILLTAIAAVGVIDILIYWNIHLYNKAHKLEVSQKKIIALEKKVAFPDNDLIFYELGKTYFDLGVNNISDINQSRDYLQNSITFFNQSLKINPANYFAHFDLARALLYLSYLWPSKRGYSHDEFKKAAILAGENTQIFFEVAKVFLSRWSRLSREDKDFTLEIMRKVAQSQDKERFKSLLHLWAMNIKDYEVIEKNLPEEAKTYRIYAQFLGEKSLSLEKRQKALAKAELLEFGKAKQEFEAGQQAFFYFKLREASKHFKICLNIISKIKFYQIFAQKHLIDPSEFNKVKKLALLDLAKCQIEQGQEFKKIEPYLSEYLSLENNSSALADFESYLKNRGFIEKELSNNLSDLDRFSFELLLYFKQGRTREIMKAGHLLEKSLIIIPENKKNSYVRILDTIGDSYQKIDYLYDGQAFYQKALELEPNNIETLVRIRQNYEALSAVDKVLQINEKIRSVISPQEIIDRGFTIEKGKRLSKKLIFDGRKKFINLYYESVNSRMPTLISVFFNGHVIWEDYLNEETISLLVKPELGENLLQIEAVNRPVRISKIKWEEG